jgi:hypothetical protein
MKKDSTAFIASMYEQLSPQLSERDLRLFVAALAKSYGPGGVELLHNITGMARSTIKRGQEELAVEANLRSEFEGAATDLSKGEVPRRVRRSGGGRPKKDRRCPLWIEALESLVEPGAKGAPESALRWTIKSSRTLSNELKNLGFDVCPNAVLSQLYANGFSLKGNHKTISNSNPDDRHAQFDFIDKRCLEFMKSNNPVISLDAKKKELLGDFKNQCRQWSSKGTQTRVDDHDFPDPKPSKALPYSAYDPENNQEYIYLGTNHETSEFTINSILGWWVYFGKTDYKNASKILITADLGDSNGHRLHLWNYNLQNIADKIQLPITICHFPPGISKWNDVEHKLFSFISLNWQGEPLKDYEIVVKLISSTKTATEVAVSCVMDDSEYKTGVKLAKEQISSINLVKEQFHGEWNYTILPK